MPGRGDEALLRADVPGIHVLLSGGLKGRGWPGQARPRRATSVIPQERKQAQEGRISRRRNPPSWLSGAACTATPDPPHEPGATPSARTAEFLELSPSCPGEATKLCFAPTS